MTSKERLKVWSMMQRRKKTGFQPIPMVAPRMPGPSIDRIKPVCEKCMVICERKYSDAFGGRRVWFECPICKNGDAQLDTEDCGMSIEDLEGNLQFQKFARGIDDAPIEPKPDGAK